jgi:hypothetical protein
MAVRDADLQPGLDGAQVLVGRAAQVGQPRVVGGIEGMAQDHARIVPHCRALFLI